jgi:hypothetical protein
MINLKVDEAYAFDFLSILEIKSRKNPLLRTSYLECRYHIANQLSEKLFKDIIISNEYLELLETNQKTFEAVDKAKLNLIDAKYVDECNYERYLKKQALQNKFFKTKLEETKIGYK